MTETLSQRPDNAMTGEVAPYVPLLRRPAVRLAVPILAGVASLAAAISGALVVGSGGGVDGVNSFVEGLSGDSGSFLGDIGFLAPLGFAFAAGMVSAVNPCGFAMLPAYLSLYLGSSGQAGGRQHPVRQLSRALLVGGAVTAGFVLLFGVAGAAIGGGAQFVVGAIPWLGLIIGVLLVFVGAWVLSGGKLYTALAGRAASHMGNAGQVNVRGYFLFGLSYGTASLSCTLPIFLAVLGTSLAVADIPTVIGEFLLFALGMGLVVMALTLGMAVFKGSMVGLLRRALPIIQPASSVLMLVAGSYIVFYWLTIGGLF